MEGILTCVGIIVLATIFGGVVGFLVSITLIVGGALALAAHDG
jgi:hypothetical protein